MKKACIILAVSLFCEIIKCQDLLSLISPLLRSAVPNREVETNNGRGLIQKFVKLGTNIGQQLLQTRITDNRRKLKLSQAIVSKPSASHSLSLISRITTRPRAIIMTATTPLPISNHEDYDLIAKNFHGTKQASSDSRSHFLINSADRSHIARIQKNQSFSGQWQHHVSTQKTFQFYRNSRRSALRFQTPQSVFSDAVRETINFGQEITGLLDEITRYSDAHHRENQDYESVRRLLNTFFNSMSSDQNNNSHTRWLKPMNDGTETGRNRPLVKNLFESDIVLTVDQLKRIINKSLTCCQFIST
ncbi:Zinc metalloproteinase nas-30 [Dirofilaria immitis]